MQRLAHASHSILDVYAFKPYSHVEPCKNNSGNSPFNLYLCWVWLMRMVVYGHTIYVCYGTYRMRIELVIGTYRWYVFHWLSMHPRVIVWTLTPLIHYDHDKSLVFDSIYVHYSPRAFGGPPLGSLGVRWKNKIMFVHL